MAKGVYEKSIRISKKPAKKPTDMESYVSGTRQTPTKKPKSLTPLPKKKR